MDCQCSPAAPNQDFLFDDENVVKIPCLKCRKPLHSPMGNGQANGYLNRSSKGHINGDYTKLLDVGDDHNESSEDAPLITDCFNNSEKTFSFHCHDVCNEARNDTKAMAKLVSASVFCFLFMIAELTGGYLAGSLAVMTDAAHLFSDFVGFLISILAICMASKPRTKYMTFGYQRAEVLGAFLSVLTIWLLVLLFSYLAIVRLYKKDNSVNADTMMIVAGIGLLVNLVIGGILHGVCHAHSHGGVSLEPSENMNVRAAAAHVIGDLLQSVGVLLAAFIIKFFPNCQAADPICTLIFSIIVIFTTARVAKDSIFVLMEGSPVNRDQIILELKKIPNIKHVHDIQIWSLAPGRNVVSTHLGVDSDCDRDLIVEQATLSIKRMMPIVSCTVQVEPYNGDSINCLECSLRQC